MADKKFIKEFEKVQNKYRARHQVGKVKHNAEISKIAQKWADHLVSSGKFETSKDRQFKGEPMGENLGMKWTSTGDDFTGAQVADQWYGGVSKYNFSTYSGTETGLFTQMVWKDSKEFGIGKAKNKENKWIVVANYWPAGNVVGRHPQNVFPAKDGDTTPIGAQHSEKKSSSGKRRSSSSSSSSDSDSETKKVTNKLAASNIHGGEKTVTTREEILPDGRKKTTITETVVGKDGTKSVTTKETIGPADSGAKHSPATAKKASPRELDNFADDVVKYHNKYRKLHGKVGDLKRSKDLDASAQKWADHLARTGKLENSNEKYKGEEVGENISSKRGTGGCDYTGEAIVEQWYKEVEKFKFDDYQQETGHFTQMVWKGTKEIGVGKAFSQDGVYVVCHYYPGGNILGHFKDNVLRK